MIIHHRAKPTIASLEATLADNIRDADDRQRRINECQVENTDCAVSMWSSGVQADLLNVKLELARNNWKHTFMVLHKDGKVANGRRVETCFGTRWVIDDKFYPCYGVEETPRRAANFKKAGFSWVSMELDAHAAQAFGSFIGCAVPAFAVPDDSNLIVA